MGVYVCITMRYLIIGRLVQADSSQRVLMDRCTRQKAGWKKKEEKKSSNLCNIICQNIICLFERWWSWERRYHIASFTEIQSLEAKSARYMGRIQTCSTRTAVSWERCRHSLFNSARYIDGTPSNLSMLKYIPLRDRINDRAGARIPMIDQKIETDSPMEWLHNRTRITCWILIYSSYRDSQFSKFHADIYTYSGPFFLFYFYFYWTRPTNLEIRERNNIAPGQHACGVVTKFCSSKNLRDWDTLELWFLLALTNSLSPVNQVFWKFEWLNWREFCFWMPYSRYSVEIHLRRINRGRQLKYILVCNKTL